MVQQRRKFLNLRFSAIQIQSFCRQVIQRNRFLELKGAAQFMQRTYRAKKDKELFLNQRSAALVIQANRRMVVAKRSFRQLKWATLTVQKVWRGQMARKLRKKLDNERDQRAALVIQKHWRMVQQRRRYLRMRSSVIQIQAFGRQVIERNRFLMLKKAAQFVQRAHG